MSASIRLERTGVAREAAEMILTDDSYFVTVIATARQGRVVWDNLRKVLLVNTPINNAQGLSALFSLQETSILYGIIGALLRFVCAVQHAEDGIMDLPPGNTSSHSLLVGY
jgi:magnesium-transporting ATPase (P-type)